MVSNIPEGLARKAAILAPSSALPKQAQTAIQRMSPQPVAPRARVLHWLTQRLRRNRYIYFYMFLFVVSEHMPAIFPYCAQPPHSANLC